MIYCTDKNFEKYINVVQEVIAQNPKIIFNSPHLLGIPYDEHIYCGTDFNNGRTSYTEKLCEDICTFLNENHSPEEIADLIDSFKEKHVPAIYALAEMSPDFGMK